MLAGVPLAAGVVAARAAVTVAVMLSAAAVVARVITMTMQHRMLVWMAPPKLS